MESSRRNAFDVLMSSRGQDKKHQIHSKKSTTPSKRTLNSSLQVPTWATPRTPLVSKPSSQHQKATSDRAPGPASPPSHDPHPAVTPATQPASLEAHEHGLQRVHASWVNSDGTADRGMLCAAAWSSTPVQAATTTNGLVYHASSPHCASMATSPSSAAGETRLPAVDPHWTEQEQQHTPHQDIQQQTHRLHRHPRIPLPNQASASPCTPCHPSASNMREVPSSSKHLAQSTPPSSADHQAPHPLLRLAYRPCASAWCQQEDRPAPASVPPQQSHPTSTHAPAIPVTARPPATPEAAPTATAPGRPQGVDAAIEAAVATEEPPGTPAPTPAPAPAPSSPPPSPLPHQTGPRRPQGEQETGCSQHLNPGLANAAGAEQDTGGGRVATVMLQLPPAKRQARYPPFGARQKCDYFLVYDLEATCNKARTLAPVEIIELSCVVANAQTLEITGEYQSYVQPTERPRLDPFCIELTGIQQQWVDQAPGLAQVLLQHDAWLSELGLLQPGVTLLPVTWTDWDLKVCLEQECEWRGVTKPPYLQSWCDLKKVFYSKLKKGGNLRSCVQAAGLTWEGRAHSGIDDARNTAQLALHLIRNHGAVLAVSDRFRSSGGKAQGAAGAEGPKLKQSLLAPAPARSLYDSQGRWSGQCKCGVRAHLRVTKKPGANHGRQFYSCGKWSITDKGRQCDFFQWLDVPQGTS